MCELANRSTEELLVQYAKTGDGSMFTEVVNRHFGSVLRRCQRVVHDRAAAQEIAQETFRCALEHARSFRGGRAEAWLLTIALNLSINRVRGRTREKLAVAEIGAMPDLRDNHRASPELRLLVQAVMDRLDPKHRVALKLLYWQGLSYQEIGEITGWREGAVRSYVQNGRIQFAKWWNQGAQGAGA